MEKTASDRASGTGRKNGRQDACALREIQLQVQNQQPHRRHHDPDSDSLTDSGKGPSEEGDGARNHTDSTDDNIQPPLPPRQPKMPCVQHQYPHKPRQHSADTDCTNSWPRNQGPQIPKRNRSECVRPTSVLGVTSKQRVGGDTRRQSPNYLNGNIPPYYMNQTVTANGKSVHFHPDTTPSQRPGHMPQYAGHSMDNSASATCPSGPSSYGPQVPYYSQYGTTPSQTHEHESDESEQSCDDGDSSTSGSFVLELDDNGGRYGRDIIV